jgi:hypothetical protein
MEKALVCVEQRNLSEEYDLAVARLSELAKSIKDLHGAAFDAAYEKGQLAAEEAQRARLRLDKHRQEHGC